MNKSTETILIVGVAAVALYMFMRPNVQPATAFSPYGGMPVYNPYQVPQQAPGTSAGSIIAASGTAASSILNAIANF